MWQVLSKKDEIAEAQQKLVDTLTLPERAQGPIDCEVRWRAHRHAQNRHPINAYWTEKEGFWFATIPPGSPSLPELPTRRYINVLGTPKPERGVPVKDYLEINVPEAGIQRQVQGAFFKDADGGLLLVHRGRLAGGNQFLERFAGRRVEIYDGKNHEVALVCGLGPDQDKTIRQVGDFVHEVYRLKKGNA